MADWKKGTLGRGEQWLLSYYAASELAGGLLMGKLARWARDPTLRAKLVWHCAEETRHAWLWTETLLDLGSEPLPVHETYQSRYFAALASPADEVELLVGTQVFERRVARHFAEHLRRPQVEPRVSETLRVMLTDEAHHLGWVGERIARSAAEGREADVHDAFQRYQALDREIYAQEIERFAEQDPELVPFAVQLREASRHNDES